MARPASTRRKKTVAHHRRLQKRIAKADRRHPPRKVDSAVQAGARAYPAPPFPRQHQRKPGQESRLDPAPMFEAPFYKGRRSSGTRSR